VEVPNAYVTIHVTVLTLKRSPPHGKLLIHSNERCPSWLSPTRRSRYGEDISPSSRGVRRERRRMKEHDWKLNSTARAEE